MPAGGTIPADGRPPQAKGVGKTARRHDLEAPATPGLSGTDLQHGDVQRLEQAQQAAPRAKKQNASGQTAAARPQAAPRTAPAIEVPDAIDFIGGRASGTLDPQSIGTQTPPPNVEAWQPLLREIARDPNASGPLTTTLLTQLSNISRMAGGATVEVIDQNAAEDAIRASIV